jgi:ParB family transcriptional regulator, chromosome partitioning protein
MGKKNALGRGLGALIDGADQDMMRAPYAINEIAVKDIVANPWQPRSNFDEEAMDELASSIRKIGIVQPITVRLLDNGKYQLITGERRYRAALKIGLIAIPAYIREADDENMLEMALVENIQREDLNAIEVAIGYQRLIEECNFTQESLSDRVGKKRATISNYLRLLKLPAEIQLGLREDKISMGHARALINIEETEDQLKAFDVILKNDLSVRKVEEFVRKMQESKKVKDKSSSLDIPKEYDMLKTHLSHHFGTSVGFTRNTKGAGKIVIPFSSDEELEKIIAILDRLNA